MTLKIKDFLIQTNLEDKILDELSVLHLFVGSLSKKDKVDITDLSEKINKAKFLRNQNNWTLAQILEPLKKTIAEIECRFQARSDMLFGIETYLKKIRGD